MNEYTRIRTSAEVWAVIHARHRGELKVFSSCSDPDGGQFTAPHTGFMFTAYGFDGAPCPLIEAETRWDHDFGDDGRKTYLRKNEQHDYWLCVPVKEKQDDHYIDALGMPPMPALSIRG